MKYQASVKIFLNSIFEPHVWLILIFCCSLANSCLTHNRSESNAITRQWKYGVELFSFNQFSFDTSLNKADSCGVDLVESFYDHKMGNEFGNKMMAELSTDEIKKVKQMLDTRQLRMESFYMGGVKTSDEWLHFFEMAKAWEVKYLVCEPPKKDLDMLDSLAGIYNMKIAIHEHSKKSSLYWHPDSVLAAINGRENIGACADVGHWVRSGLDPVECLKKLRGHVLELHLKDVGEVGNHEAEDVLVGTGVIDFKGVIAELKEQCFAGIVYVECEHNFQNNVPDVLKALKYFQDLAK